jgi:tetratricopeptide (TPR) repeat protein
MKRLWQYIFILAILPGVVLAEGEGGTTSPFSLGAGARALALGGSDLAFADAAAAPYWNPAALTETQYYTLSGFMSRLYESDVAYQYLGLAIPTLDWGCFGLGIFRLGIDNIERRDAANFHLYDFDDTRLGYYLAYGLNVSGYNLGVAVTMESHSLDEYSTTSSPGLNLSVGRILEFKNKRLSRIGLALTGQNILKPKMELVDVNLAHPLTLSFGGTVEIHPMKNDDHQLALSVKLNKIDKIDLAVSTGLEYSLHDACFLRGGINKEKFAFGGGLKWKYFAFDYAWVDRDMGGLHMFSITTALGRSVETRLDDRRIRREIEFNDMMNRRLTEKNGRLVSELENDARKKIDAGLVEEAVGQFDRALFMARANGLDTVSIQAGLSEALARMEQIQRKVLYSRHLDSAQARFNMGDVIGTGYYAGLALELYANSPEARELRDKAEAIIIQNRSQDKLLNEQLAAADSLINYGFIAQAQNVISGLARFAPDDDRVRLAVKRLEFEMCRDVAGNAYERGDYRAAINALDSALILFPDHKWCLNLKERARQKLTEQRSPTQTPKTQELPPVSPRMAQEVSAEYEQGRQLFESGNLQNAIARWENVERLAPDYQNVRQYLVKAYKFVGVELYGQNKLAEAIDVWNKAARLDPENTEIRDYIRRSENEIRKLKELSYGQ